MWKGILWHRAGHPRCRAEGRDIGGGPTAAGCQLIGERRTGSGVRSAGAGAATVAAPGGLSASGGPVWTAPGPNCMVA